MKCRICGEEIKDFELVKRMEAYVNGVYSKYIETKKVDVKFYHCSLCGHNQIPDMLQETYYKKYSLLNIDGQMTAGGGHASARQIYYSKVLEILGVLATDQEKFLDIGCGNGTLLKLAEKNFQECIGIEPSEEECKVAELSGCTVRNTFFDQTFSEEGFSGFIATQVWEHLSQPLEMFSKVYEILKVGGIGYIDVPNGEEVYQRRAYYDLFLEHINYFSVESMVEMAKRAGFEVIKIEKIFDEHHLGMIVKKTKTEESFELRECKDREKVGKILENSERVAIWGAGIKGRVYIAHLCERHKEKIQYIFDSNQLLWGKYIGNCKVSISEPTIQTIQDIEIVIITAIEYKGEITKILRAEYGFKGRIVCIDEQS